MTKKELLNLLETVKEEESIDELIKGTDLAKSMLNIDNFKGLVATDTNFKSFMDSEKDKYSSKALKTWKENNLEKELEPFIKEKYPDLITDPLQKKLLEQEKKIADMEKASARKDLLTEALKYATEKKLPSNFVEKFLGEDLETTKTNLDALAEDWSKGIELVVEEKMKTNSYVPGTGSDGKPVSVGSLLASQANKATVAQNDPWASK